MKHLSKKINGFKIIKDFGRKNNKRRVIVRCKVCKIEFETSLYHLHIIKSCGCIKRIEIVPKGSVINGFEIIKDFGHISRKITRMSIVKCRVCKKEFKIAFHKLNIQKSCGCMNNGGKVCLYRHTHPRLLRIYRQMIRRCYKKWHPDYKWYGKKKISVCDEWQNHPDNFCRWALENGYQNNLTIDRIDSYGNYEINNCRWADSKTQIRNRNYNTLTLELAKNMRIDRFEKKMKYKELSKKYNVSVGTVNNVVNNKSWI